MKQSIHLRIVNFAARLCLGLVFVVAAIAKLFNLSDFAQRVGEFGLVFDTLVTPTVWVVVVAELLIGVSLVFRWPGSLVCAVGLLLIFVGVLSYGIALGLDIECGCFGPAVHVSLGTQLLADLGLLLVCAIIYATHYRPPNNSNTE